jgi:hypothetical protein
MQTTPEIQADFRRDLAGQRTSGLLCLSTVCEGKFLTHSAASSVDRMQSRYDLRALAWRQARHFEADFG